MTKPLYEPSTQRGVAANAWGVSQLQRRPELGGGECSVWHYVGEAGEPAFENSWVNVGSPYQTLRFRVQSCDLEIEGTVTGGTAGTVVFTLPVGFRPNATLFVPGVDDTFLFIAWELDNTGAVTRL